MLEYIVLGEIPGTSLRLGFIGYLALFDLVLVLYLLKKYHPKQWNKLLSILKVKEAYKWADNELKVLEKKFWKLERKLARKTKLYKRRALKQLIRFRNNVLSPKLKFLK